jgi:hypothetical protein
MGTELVPEMLYSNELTRLWAREDYIAFSWFVDSELLNKMHGEINIKSVESNYTAVTSTGLPF